jgi:hypothetical protein
MKPTTWAAMGALLAASYVAHAQPSQRAPDPADPSAPVPPLVYESSIPASPAPAKEAEPSPDKAWRAANETVAGSKAADEHHHH